MDALSISMLVAFVVLAIGFGLSGLDDLVFDLVYWARRTVSGRPYRPVALTTLDAEPQRRVALFVPAWHEADVIEEMLLRHTRVIDYDAYDIFVGTYPNDPDTQAAVERAAAVDGRVHKCVSPTPGPTTKADNLNAVLDHMTRHEAQAGVHYDAVMLHDAEDLLHPYELKLVNHHLGLETAEMIQTPILPVRAPLAAWTQATYMDQFAEGQTKDMHVRRWLGGFVPSCGVATTLTRGALATLRADHPDGRTFDPSSLTEDYELGFKLSLAGTGGVFLDQEVVQDRPPTGDRRPERRVTTRSEFPDRFRTAVRQRARWGLGIVFQSWQRNGWAGSLAHRWLLFHDRKAPWANTMVLLGYLFLAVLILAPLLGLADRETLLPETGWTWPVLIGLGLLMLNRLLQRAIAVGRVYGVPHAVLSVLRQPWDNVINIAATYRASRQFVQSVRSGRAPAWDKTQHVVPKAARRAAAEAPAPRVASPKQPQAV